MPSQIKTNVRNRRKATSAKPRTGTVPNISAIAAIGPASPNEVSIGFDVPVLIAGLPAWETTGLSPNLTAQSIVSKTATSVVLDFGADVTGFTGITVPQGASVVRSSTGQPIPPGEYSA